MILRVRSKLGARIRHTEAERFHLDNRWEWVAEG